MNITVLLQILETFISGVGVVVNGLLSMLPLYKEMIALKNQIISSAFGIPLTIVTIASAALSLARTALKRFL